MLISVFWKRPITVLLLGVIAMLIISIVILLFNTMNYQTIKYERFSGPISNPLMGWAPWATIKESEQPHTLVYTDLTWRDFEPKEGFFDFDTFEKRQQLGRWRQEGKRVVFRFVADIPGEEGHLDIPDWLFEKINRSGDFYSNEYGKGFSPDYSNQIFINHHKNVLKALGERYGKDGFFAYVELGSLGHWGEWHTHPAITPLPTEEIRNIYVQHYVEAFPGIHLLMRRPFAIAEKLGLGLYNDMTADPTQTRIWLGWIKNGGEFLPGEVQTLSSMPNGWQNAPIGGEQSPILSNKQIYATDLNQTIHLLKESHATFIGPSSPYEVELTDPLQDGIDQVAMTIGYRIYVDYVQMPQKILFGQRMKIAFTFSNDGIAPMYYNWPTYLYLFDANGVSLDMHQTQIDFRKVLPGEIHRVVVRMPIDNLKNGTYSVAIAIIDPITGQPAVKFANENPRQDLIQYIGLFEVKKIFNHND